MITVAELIKKLSEFSSEKKIQCQFISGEIVFNCPFDFIPVPQSNLIQLRIEPFLNEEDKDNFRKQLKEQE